MSQSVEVEPDLEIVRWNSVFLSLFDYKIIENALTLVVVTLKILFIMDQLIVCAKSLLTSDSQMSLPRIPCIL